MSSFSDYISIASPWWKIKAWRLGHLEANRPTLPNQHLLPTLGQALCYTKYNDKKDLVPSLMDHPMGGGRNENK